VPSRQLSPGHLYGGTCVWKMKSIITDDWHVARYSLIVDHGHIGAGVDTTADHHHQMRAVYNLAAVMLRDSPVRVEIYYNHVFKEGR
jgi:hypothetical protein